MEGSVRTFFDIEEYIEDTKVGIYSFYLSYYSVFVSQISLWYPLNPYLLGQYEKIWDWSLLTRNINIFKSQSRIERYENKWDWGSLSTQDNVDWTPKLISKYEDRWDWGSLSNNSSIFWTNELLRKYKNRLSWYSNDPDIDEEGGLCTQSTVNWDLATIQEFKNYIDVPALCGNTSIKWNIDLINFLKDELNWDALSANRELNWTFDLLDKFLDDWNWEMLSANSRFMWFHENPLEITCFGWTSKWIDKYEKHMDFNALLSNNRTYFPIEIFEKYFDRFNWSLVSKSIQLFDPSLWIDFVEMYREHIDWNMLSQNQQCWGYLSDEFIEKHANDINWAILSANKEARWRPYTIDRYAKYLNWQALASNPNVIVTDKIFKKYYKELIDAKIHENQNFSLNRENIKMIKMRDNEYHPTKHFLGHETWRPKHKRYFEFEQFRNANWCDDLMYRDTSVSRSIFRLTNFMPYDNISENPYLPWNIQLINRYIGTEAEEGGQGEIRKHFKYHRFHLNEVAWVMAFKPYVDDMLITKVISDHLQVSNSSDNIF